MIEKMIFNRLFSLTMYKNKTIPLGEMSFSKDFINDTRGNLYPVLKRSDNCIETLKDGKYTVEQGEVRRFICRFFPYASYRIEFTDLQGETGFEFDLKKTRELMAERGVKNPTSEDVFHTAMRVLKRMEFYEGYASFSYAFREIRE